MTEGSSMPISRRTMLKAAALVAAAPGGALAAGTPSAGDAYLYIIWPQDGDRIRGAFYCRFGLRNMGVAHAGDSVANSGHHHLLVDVDDVLDPALPIPADKSHLHFGGGQTETRLDLPPGPHTLQLVLGDANHMMFDPPVVSRKIHIVVLK